MDSIEASRISSSRIKKIATIPMAAFALNALICAFVAPPLALRGAVSAAKPAAIAAVKPTLYNERCATGGRRQCAGRPRHSMASSQAPRGGAGAVTNVPFICILLPSRDPAPTGKISMALSFAALPLSFQAPALAPRVAPAGVSMRQSEALPFLEAPPQLDGTMAGDVVS